MAKAKGSPKTGGRKKGSLNKRNQDVADKLAALDCDPIVGMAKIAKDAVEANDAQLALTAYKELAQYVAPKRKQTDTNMHVTGNLHDDRIQKCNDLNDRHLKHLKQISPGTRKSA